MQSVADLNLPNSPWMLEEDGANLDRYIETLFSPVQTSLNLWIIRHPTTLDVYRKFDLLVYILSMMSMKQSRGKFLLIEDEKMLKDYLQVRFSHFIEKLTYRCEFFIYKYEFMEPDLHLLIGKWLTSSEGLRGVLDLMPSHQNHACKDWVMGECVLDKGIFKKHVIEKLRKTVFAL